MENVKSMNKTDQGTNWTEIALRLVVVFALLYFFLVGVKTLETSIKFLGGGFANGLFNLTSNPITALLSGILATALIQSSSVTTSIIVGLVSSGTLPLTGAIPMIMGANMGTSVTNTIVSLGYINNKENFKKAFAAATVHDFFNVLTVAVMLPLELATGFLERTATVLSSAMYGSIGGVKYSSPVKAAIKPAVNSIKGFVTQTLGFESFLGGCLMALVAAVIIIFSLATIVKVMKVLVESNKGEIINNLLGRKPYIAILFGAALTISVQSSSITTSLLVPMAGAGLLNLEAIYPVTVGANIGTTATALLASLTGNVAGLAIALVHFVFNLCGTLLWYVPKDLRKLPIFLANRTATFLSKNRAYSVFYVLLFFFGVPLVLTYLFK